MERRFTHCIEARSAPVEGQAQQPPVTTFNPGNVMPVEIRPEEHDSPEQVEDILFTDEFSAGSGLGQHNIEFVQLAARNHVHVGDNFVALGVTDQVQV